MANVLTVTSALLASVLFTEALPGDACGDASRLHQLCYHVEHSCGNQTALTPEHGSSVWPAQGSS